MDVCAATIEAVQMELSTPVKYIKRVGERVAAGLAERGVVTVEDLLYHLPFRYEDRLHPKPLAEYQVGDVASLIGEVRGTILLRTRSGPIFEMTVGVRPPAEGEFGGDGGIVAAASDGGAGDGEVPVVSWQLSEGQVQAGADGCVVRQAGGLAEWECAERDAGADAIQDGAADV